MWQGNNTEARIMLLMSISCHYQQAGSDRTRTG